MVESLILAVILVVGSIVVDPDAALSSLSDIVCEPVPEQTLKETSENEAS